MFETDRPYGYNQGQAAAGARAQEGALLLARVCFLTIGAVLCTMLGAAVTWVYPSPVLVIGGLIGMFIMLFVCQAVARRFPINLLALAVFAGLEGLAMGAALRIYAGLNSGPMIVVQAATLAIVIFAMVGTLGFTSTRSYAHWLPWLFGGLILLIVAGIILWFVRSPGAHWLYSVGGCVLFIAFIFVDFTRIRHDYRADDYIPATISVYLDLINLFWFILRLLSSRRD